MEFIQKVLKVMADMGNVPKNGIYNAYGTKYNFVTNDDITSKLQTALVKNGILLIPEIISVKQEPVTSKSGTVGTHTALELLFTVTDGEGTFQAKWHSESLDYQDKGIGKALTLGKKYFIISLFEVATGNKEDDPDEGIGAEEVTEKKAEKQTVKEEKKDDGKKVTKEQLDQYNALSEEAKKRGLRPAIIDDRMPADVFSKVYQKLVDSINEAKE